MNTLYTFPIDDGFYMPAEFSPHFGCIMIFPERPDSWQYGGYAARRAFAKVAAAISKSEKVTVCASFRQYENARALLPPDIRVVEMSSNDAWARDYAPTFLTNGKTIRGVNWSFNAWGGLVDGLYFPWDKDDAMARKLCDLYEKDMYDMAGFVLEGGSIHVDGEGTVITTEACLLSKGRNPSLTKPEIEQKLKDCLGASKVVWLKRGIFGDETNEHVDNICAFVKPSEVVLAWTDDKNDPQYEISRSCYDILMNETDAKGRRFTVHKLVLPAPVTMTEEECAGLDLCGFKPTRTPGERLAASYVNFYISNGAVVMPFFGDPADEPAKQKLSELFSDREMIPVYARDILIGGGNIHCITQQIPAFAADGI